MKIKISAGTDVGKERTNNEDAFIICPDLLMQDWNQSESNTYIPCGKYGSLMVVADGMGGENAGEIASAIATKYISQAFSKEAISQSLEQENFESLIRTSIIHADEAINKKICEDLNTSGMGTTVVVCWIIDNVAHIGWCGDSRCYVYNPMYGIKQLTKDHSLVQELVDKGQISEEEVFTHPDNSVITKGLGDVNILPMPDFVSYPLKDNDMVLLCSDGLCGYCSNSDIEKVIERNYSDANKCRDELIRYALDLGGFDNICVVVASVIGNEQMAPSLLSTKQKIFLKIKKLMKA